MARERTAQTDEVPQSGPEVAATKKPPRALEIASEGLRSTEEGFRFCEAMIVDCLNESIPYPRASVVLRGYTAMLKTVEVTERYGHAAKNGRKVYDFVAKRERRGA